MEEFQLILTMAKDGKVNVKGPIANKVLCYGVLEAAKEIIQKWNELQGKAQLESKKV